MKKKDSFTQLVRLWGVVLLISMTVVIMAVDMAASYRHFLQYSRQIRSDYIEQKKNIVKDQVMLVVDYINNEWLNSEFRIRGLVKSHVLEACAIAENIYRENVDSKSRHEIEKMIKDALRPVRFADGLGYFFATRLDGVEVLFSDKPELEGENLLNLQDKNGKYVIRDMIDIALGTGEGFYDYYWTKPDSKGDFHQKISFIKLVRPCGFFIGAGFYVNDIEGRTKKELLKKISKIRYGKEGYIFINRFNGDALVSNGIFMGGAKKLWNAFDSDYKEKLKKIFDMEYRAAMKPDGDYIRYSWIKLTEPDKKSPKISFIYGLKEFKWIVGAGVYLDDLEEDILALKKGIYRQLIDTIVSTVVVMLSVILIFLFFIQRLSRRIENDFNLFISFFQSAAHSDKEIDIDKVKLQELDKIAGYANLMLRDKKEARKQILDQKERLFVTIRSIGDGVISTDLNGRITLMNQLAESMTGWNFEDAKGKFVYQVLNLFDSDRREKIDNPVFDVLNTGSITALSRNSVLISKDGTEYLINDSGAPIRDSSGIVVGAVIVFRDVSQEFRVREELRRSEENLRRVFEAAQSVSFIKTDTAGKDAKIIEFSPGAENIFGYKACEIKGKPFSTILLSDEVNKLPGIFHFLSSRKTGYSGEFTLVRKTGAVFPAYFSIYPVFDNNGELVEAIAVSIDISNQKKAEEELLKIEKLQSIGTLAGGIAHDFNNILMGLFGNISIAKDKLSDDHPARRSLVAAEASMNRAIGLTRQLLTFAKGGVPIIENVFLPNLVSKTVSFDLSGSNVKAIYDYSEDLWMAEVDPGQISQVVSNLAINADHAMPDGGNLFFSFENVELIQGEISDLMAGRYVKVIVRDEGIGIEEHNIAKIFDPYFTTKDGGSGLGLATAFSIIKRHNGLIEVASKPGQGTAFTIYLPASDDGVIDSQSAEEKEQDSVSSADIRILVMDDDKMICEVVKEALESEGFVVDSTQDGRNAIEIYKNSVNEGKAYDLVIMDLTVPGGVGGKEAVREMLLIDPGVRAIVSSGYAEDPVMSRYKEFGFKGTVPKPYKIEELLKVVRDVLR